jgi:hypothetical protein
MEEEKEKEEEWEILGNGQYKVFSHLLQFTLRQNPPTFFVTK